MLNLDVLRIHILQNVKWANFQKKITHSLSGGSQVERLLNTHFGEFLYTFRLHKMYTDHSRSEGVSPPLRGRIFDVQTPGVCS